LTRPDRREHTGTSLSTEDRRRRVAAGSASKAAAVVSILAVCEREARASMAPVKEAVA
jgi:hypothetical protein